MAVPFADLFALPIPEGMADEEAVLLTDIHANDLTVAHNGTYIWHDHRIHFLGLGTPRIVKDVHKRTLIENWYVPVEIGATKGYLFGKLFWNAEAGSSFPIGAIIALIVVVIGGTALVIVVRRRRASGPRREAW